jgi:hypothetical protein
MKWKQKYVTPARSENGLRCPADWGMLHAGSRLSSQHQQIRLLPSQLLLDENQRIAVLDRQCRSALAQPQSRDEPGRRVLGLLPDWVGELPSFLLSAERQRQGRNVVLETPLVCVKKVETRPGKEGCRKLQSCRRSACEINRDEDPSVRRLIRIADDQNRPLDPLQQALDGGGSERIRDRTPLVPAGHDEIDAMGSRARRDGPRGFSNADINAVRELAASQPSADLGFEIALGVRPLRFDRPSRKPAVDDVKDDQEAFPLEREPGRSHEGDFRWTGEIVRQEHPIHPRCEVRAHELQTGYVAARSIGGAQLARIDAGNGCPIAG